MVKARVWLDLCFLAVLVFLLVRSPSVDEGGVFDYCVEWDGWIGRESMVTNCFDFRELSIRCDWEFVNDSLNVYFLDGKVTSFNCTRWVKSKGGFE